MDEGSTLPLSVYRLKREELISDSDISGGDEEEEIAYFGKACITIFMEMPHGESINCKIEETGGKIRMDLKRYVFRIEIGWNWLMLVPSGGV